MLIINKRSEHGPFEEMRENLRQTITIQVKSAKDLAAWKAEQEKWQIEERERQAKKDAESAEWREKEIAEWRTLRVTNEGEWAQICTLYAEAGKRLDSIGKKTGSIGEESSTIIEVRRN